MTADAFRPQRPPLVTPGAIEHHVADLTVSVAADVTLDALQRKLAEHRQWLPIDGDPNLPIGQLVEINSTGPLRLGYGAWRDLLLGTQFTTLSGQFITAGGRAMKNVAGYDLTKFMVGQFGLFGKLVTITTRTYKRPETALRVQMPLSLDLVGRAIPTHCKPHWAMLIPGQLYFGYLGDEKTIAFYESAVLEFKPSEIKRQTIDQDIAFRATNWLPMTDKNVGATIRYRVSVPPPRILDFIQRAALSEYRADPAFGIIVGSCDADRKDALRKAADAVGGLAQFDDPDDLQTFFNKSGGELALLQRIESAFST